MKPRKLLLTSLFTLVALSVGAQGTAFMYQGRLNGGGSPANGNYDLQFTIYDSTNNPGVVIAGPLTNSAIGVTNGLFAVTLDFGSGVFTGSARWLEIAARTNGAPSFTTLAPRQALTPTPYALFAPNAGNATTVSGGVSASQITGTLTNSTSGSAATATYAASAGMASNAICAASLVFVNTNYLSVLTKVGSRTNWTLGYSNGIYELTPFFPTAYTLAITNSSTFYALFKFNATLAITNVLGTNGTLTGVYSSNGVPVIPVYFPSNGIAGMADLGGVVASNAVAPANPTNFGGINFSNLSAQFSSDVSAGDTLYPNYFLLNGPPVEQSVADAEPLPALYIGVAPYTGGGPNQNDGVDISNEVAVAIANGLPCNLVVLDGGCFFNGGRDANGHLIPTNSLYATPYGSFANMIATLKSQGFAVLIRLPWGPYDFFSITTGPQYISTDLSNLSNWGIAGLWEDDAYNNYIENLRYVYYTQSVNRQLLHPLMLWVSWDNPAQSGGTPYFWPDFAAGVNAWMPAAGIGFSSVSSVVWTIGDESPTFPYISRGHFPAALYFEGSNTNSFMACMTAAALEPGTLNFGTLALVSTTPAQLAIGLNPEILGIITNQYCHAGTIVVSNFNQLVMQRDLGNGQWTFGLWNTANTTQAYTVNLASLGYDATEQYIVRDLWQRTNIGVYAGTFTITNNLSPAVSQVLLTPDGEPAPVIGTNYVAANFVPTPGIAKLVPSNNWMFSVSALLTNAAFQINP